MGCASSTFLNHDEDFSQIGGSGSVLGHHIVSLTSTTYGLLSLDPSSAAANSSSSSSSSSPTILTTNPPRFTLGSFFPSPLLSEQPRPRSLRSDPPHEIINSWELMAGLDSTPSCNDSFRFQPLPALDKENSNINILLPIVDKPSIFKPMKEVNIIPSVKSLELLLTTFEELCPPKGENRVVVYTTTLRGVRSTFEACNAVRAAIEGYNVFVCERDISMDKGFKEELRELMKGKPSRELVPPRVFIKGRYVGGAEEVLSMEEGGCLGDLLDGLPKLRAGFVCDGCGGMRFLPCFNCNGSCKTVKEEIEAKQGRRSSVIGRCSDCNENGLILCPICS